MSIDRTASVVSLCILLQLQGISLLIYNVNVEKHYIHL
jgi:hypothetical protein